MPAMAEARSSGRAVVGTAPAAAGLPHKPPAPHPASFRPVPTAKRVARWVQRSGAGMAIDAASAALSLLTVATYIAQTYQPHGSPTVFRLRMLDFGCTCIFAAEWAFWLWLATDRLRFVLSLQSGIDFITVAPMLIAPWLPPRGRFHAFESMVRVLRMLRVFRIFRLGKRIKSEIHARALTLAFTLASILVTGAGMFYEIETRYSERYPDLSFSEALYWSAATITTIGYGDYSPSVPLSQMLLFVMLVVTFTLLPYQTSALLSALDATSPHQRARYSSAARGRHMVVMGHVDARTAARVVRELYHGDYGYQDFNLVLLHPSPPSEALLRLLKMHPQAHRLLYVQGSPLSHADLSRVQLESADTVLLLCDKSPPDAAREDERTTATLLAAAHYLQRAERRAAAAAAAQPPGCGGWGRLRRVLRREQGAGSGVRGEGPPGFHVQVVLPESRQQLLQLVRQMCDGSARGWGVQADLPASTFTSSSGGAVAPAAQGNAAGPQEGDGGTPLAAISLAPAAGSAALATGCKEASVAPGAGRAKHKAPFWQRFARGLRVVCVVEVRHSLLGHAAGGCPALVTLVTNLVRGVDAGGMLQSEFEALPGWLQEYLEGCAHELYQVSPLPGHLAGRPFEEVAAYVYERHGAVLLALSGGGAHAGSDKAAAAAPMVPPAVAPAAVESTDTLLLAPMGQTVPQGSTGYVIALDLRAAADIAETPETDFRAWQAQRGPVQAKGIEEGGGGGEGGSAGGEDGSAAGPMFPETLPRTATPERRRRTTGAVFEGTAAGDSLQPAGTSGPPPRRATGEPAAGEPAHTMGHVSRSRLLGPSGDHHAHRPAVLPEGAASSTATPSAAGASPLPSPRGLLTAVAGMGSRKLLRPWSAAGEGSSGGGGAVTPGAGGGRRRHRRAIEATLSGRAAATASLFDVAMMLTADGAFPSGSGLGRLAFALTCAGRGSRDLAAAMFERLYHFRPLLPLVPGAAPQLVQAPESTSAAAAAAAGGEAAANGRRDGSDGGIAHAAAIPTDPLVLEGEVQLQGHTLVISGGAPPEALLPLLAPLRSAALPQTALCPILILDAAAPTGPLWREAVARFTDLYFLEGSAARAEDLRRANAERAARAIVLSPWGATGGSGRGSEGEEEERGLATALADAAVTAVVARLRALNSRIEITCELMRPEAAIYLDPLGAALEFAGAGAEWGGGGVQAATTPACMGGCALAGDLADGVLCQSCYNSATDRVVSALLSQWHASPGGGAAPVQLPAASAAPGALTFGELFARLLAERRLLALGLVRTARQTDDYGTCWPAPGPRTAFCEASPPAAVPLAGRSSMLRYLYAAPQPATRLQPGDEVLVLAHVFAAAGGGLPPDARCCAPAGRSGGGGTGAGSAGGVTCGRGEGATSAGAPAAGQRAAAALLPLDCWEGPGGDSGSEAEAGRVTEAAGALPAAGQAAAAVANSSAWSRVRRAVQQQRGPFLPS